MVLYCNSFQYHIYLTLIISKFPKNVVCLEDLEQFPFDFEKIKLYVARLIVQ